MKKKIVLLLVAVVLILMLFLVDRYIGNVVLTGGIPDQELEINQIKEINLYNYFSGFNLSFSALPMKNIDISIKEGVATITPDEGFIGEETTIFTAYENESAINSNVVRIIVGGIVDKSEGIIEQNLTNETIQTFLIIYTDKPTYIQNETINIFGEVLVEGEEINDEIALVIGFNEIPVYSSLVNVTNGSYSYDLIADFEDEGEYIVKVSYNELSAQTSFYFLKSLITFENLSCKEFNENILWSSGYSNKPEGSYNYQTWEPKHNCTEIGVSDCFLENIEVKTRFLYFGADNESGTGYIQISEPDEFTCDNPEKGNYLQYLSFEKLNGESKSFDRYCGKNKKTEDKEKCKIEASNYRNYVKCYGIKSYGSQYMLVDALEIKYYLCLGEGG